jgi:betaine reductase
MPSANPVIRNFAYCLAHVPEWVRYGSKPRREIRSDPEIERRIDGALRDFSQAVAYPPHRVYLGDRTPQELEALPRPWLNTPGSREPELSRQRLARFGEIADTELFTALLARADVLEPPLVQLTRAGAARAAARLASHPLLAGEAGALGEGDDAAVERCLREDPEPALPLRSGALLLGAFRRDLRAEGRDDPNLLAHHLLENLSAKASGALALRWLLEREALTPGDIDYVISCGEEAVGDRYQRGGGGMAKAIAELCGCERASGMDIKNFCAAPANALVTAGALVKAGLFRRVAVVAGGSLAKLGMKFQAALARGMPVLEDCIASCAFLVTPDDARSPVLRLEPGGVGFAPVGASTSDEAVYRSLLLDPLVTLGYGVTDIDRFAPELHNPEIMELAGSGDVARKNYRSIAALAVLDGQLERAGMEDFISRVGMPGFAPTQGHIPSAVAYLGHACEALRSGEARRVFFIAKASLFLGRCTDLYDGVSFLLEANPAAGS